MKRLLTTARLVISALAFVAVMLRTDVSSLVDVIGNANLFWILVAISINLMAVCGSVLLWRSMMPQRDAPSLTFLLRTYFAGLFVNNIGLGTVMGDSLRSFELAQHQRSPVRNAAVSVIAERALSLLALCALASLGAAFVGRSEPHLAYWVWTATAAVVSGFVATYCAGFHIENAKWLPRVAHTFALDMHGALVSLVQTPVRMAHGLTYAFGIQLCAVLATMAVTWSLGATLGPWRALTVVPLIVLIVQLPISVQGIGVREGSYVLLFGFVGLPPEVALAAALISYGSTLLVSMVGGALLLQRIMNRRDSLHGRDTGLPRAA